MIKRKAQLLLLQHQATIHKVIPQYTQAKLQHIKAKLQSVQ